MTASTPSQELNERDKAAIGRLGMPTVKRRAAQPTVDSPTVQIARMSTGSAASVVTSGLASLAAVDTAVPDETSAFLDMRDPLTAANGQRPTRTQLIRFGIGFFLCALICAVPWVALSTVVLPYMFEYLTPSSKVAMVGLTNGLGAIIALLSNVLFGALSDITRTAVGRRTPWIVGGGALTSIAMWGCLQNVDTPAAVIAWWCVAQFGYNMMLAPFVASLADRIPDKVRGSISGAYGAGIAVGQTLGSIVGAALIAHGRSGVRLGWGIGVGVFVLTAVGVVLIWPREPNNRNEVHQQFHAKALADLFRPPRHAPDFMRALLGRTLMMTGYWMIITFQLYIAQDYIFTGHPDAIGLAARLIAVMAIITLITSGVGSLAAGPITDRLERRKLPVALAGCLFAFGALMPLVFRSVVGMLLFAAFAGLGYGAYCAIDQALNVAVLPDAKTAGRDLGILNMSNTLSTVLGSLLAALIVLIAKHALGVSHVPPVAFAWIFIVAIVLVLVASWIVTRIRSVR
ncbi:MFS transporter [Bifidobacterium gallicum]|uniref:Membrane protein n=1 Tax=Bifidobacterium gallicum DSM 20093 = LMG 11596 TaxID=561180 RepID=A0A087AMN1_9BIFI|nr:MFS transporter [Bifidobacterium gallicum]KFI60031.1 membrane protein [Bifidobacterium gallicum DSM 20093 = LMG 11596]